MLYFNTDRHVAIGADARRTRALLATVASLAHHALDPARVHVHVLLDSTQASSLIL